MHIIHEILLRRVHVIKVVHGQVLLLRAVGHEQVKIDKKVLLHKTQGQVLGKRHEDEQVKVSKISEVKNNNGKRPMKQRYQGQTQVR